MRKEVIILFLSILTFSTFFLPCDQFSRSMVWIYVLTGIICALLFFLNKEYDNNIRMIFLRPSLVFVIAYLIVFFQRPIDYLLGYASGYLKIGEVRFMLTSLNYAVVGLSLFIIGYLIAAKRTRTGKDIRLHTNIVSPTIYAVLSSILVAFVIILVPKEVLLGGYNNDMLTNASIYNYLASWSNTILIAYLVQFTINAKQTQELEGCSVIKYLRSVGIWQNMNVIIYTLIILNVGDRGPLIVLALSYYLSYIIVSNRKISKIRIIAVFCIGVVITSILGNTKQYRDNNTIMDRLISLYENKQDQPKDSFLPATEQLSGSYCCLPIALQMVPEYKDFSYGGSIFSDLVAGIPFIGRVFDLPASTSYSISEYAMGADFSFGLGTNCLAALYMDGGLFFIILGMFAFGIILRKFEVCIFSNTTSSFFVFCMAFYFLTRVVYIPRSSLFSPFKYALWMYVIMALISYLAPKKRYSA